MSSRGLRYYVLALGLLLACSRASGGSDASTEQPNPAPAAVPDPTTASSSRAAPAEPRAPADASAIPSEDASPFTPQRRDRTILAVFTAVRDDPLLRNEGIKITARGSSLVVKGVLSTSAAHDRVLEIARAGAGSFTLLDSLQVAGS